MTGLTNSEKLVMKVIWESAEELGLTDIMDILTRKYEKDWKPQTVSTFLARLVQKGYINGYRKGRVHLYHILIPEEKYLAQMANEFLTFWFHDKADEFLSVLLTIRPLREDEINKIKSMLFGKRELDDAKVEDYGTLSS